MKAYRSAVRVKSRQPRKRKSFKVALKLSKHYFRVPLPISSIILLWRTICGSSRSSGVHRVNSVRARAQNSIISGVTPPKIFPMAFNRKNDQACCGAGFKWPAVAAGLEKKPWSLERIVDMTGTYWLMKSCSPK